MKPKKKGGTTGGVQTAVGQLETLNFKVPQAFKREFKVYAAQQDMTMLELLKEGFRLTKQKRGS